MRLRFAAMGSPHRNDADGSAAPGPDQRKERTVDARRRLPARFLAARRWKGNGWASIEEQWCIGKVEPAILQRRPTFFLVPLEEHPDVSNVCTSCYHKMYILP